MRNLLLGGLVCLSLPQLAAASLVVNGSFEGPDYNATETDGLPHYYYTLNAPSLTGWTLSGPNITLLDSRAPYWVAPDESQYIELEARTSSSISQLIATTPGEVYALRFAYAASGYYTGVDDSVSVFWNGTLLDTVDRDGSSIETLDWGYYDYLVAATSTSTELRFSDGSVGQHFVGPYLDDVSLNAVAGAPVPEPSSALLFALGIVGLIGHRRLRKPCP
jgi:hypothetical protein